MSLLAAAVTAPALGLSLLRAIPRHMAAPQAKHAPALHSPAWNRPHLSHAGLNGAGSAAGSASRGCLAPRFWEFCSWGLGRAPPQALPGVVAVVADSGPPQVERCIHHVRHFHWVPILGCALSSAFCLAGGLRRRPGDPSCRSRDGRSWPCNSGILGRHSVDK
ncbi:hypothetical protein Bca4012_099650 [Brassica carinata]